MINLRSSPRASMERANLMRSAWRPASHLLQLLLVRIRQLGIGVTCLFQAAFINQRSPVQGGFFSDGKDFLERISRQFGWDVL